MNLSKNNYFKNEIVRFKLKSGEVKTGTLYGYESKNAIYDVLLLDGMKYYQKNAGGWHNTIDKIDLIHNNIERHFEI